MSELLDLCDEVLRALRRLADEQEGREQGPSWQARFAAVASDDAEATAEFCKRTSQLDDVLLSLLKFTAVQAMSAGGDLNDVSAVAGLTRERLRQLVLQNVPPPAA